MIFMPKKQNIAKSTDNEIYLLIIDIKKLVILYNNTIA